MAHKGMPVPVAVRGIIQMSITAPVAARQKLVDIGSPKIDRDSPDEQGLEHLDTGTTGVQWSMACGC